MKTSPNWPKKAALSSIQRTLQYVPIPAGSHNFFPEHWALQVAYSRDKWGMTEIHAAMAIIGGISQFQLLRIHCGLLLQYFPTPWVRPARSDISRYGDSVPKPSHTENILLGFFFMETCPNWLKKMALGSLQRVLKYLQISA